MKGTNLPLSNRLAANLPIMSQDSLLEGATPIQDEHPANLPSEVEAVRLAVWRRVVEDGGRDLTLPEAAVLLGTSVESVRRRIKTGRISAFRDARGRLRIRTSLAEAPDEAATSMASLWNELKAAKQELTAALSASDELQRELGLAHYHRREAQQESQSLESEKENLQEELDMARAELEHTRQELASLWRVMSSRNQRTESSLSDMSDGNEAFDLPPSRDSLEVERSRIKGQIDRVRDLSRRRRWPWPQAS